MSMMKRFGMASALVLAMGTVARADVWDVQAQNDNSTGTENELTNGSDQLHDLTPNGSTADQDYFRLGQKPYSSWEILVDATSADIGTTDGMAVERVASDGTTVLLTSQPVTSTIKFSRSLRWQNATSNTVVNEYVRVYSTSCTTQCGADDVYRVRALETTYAITRFNNVGTQSTAVFLQNTAPYQVNGNLFFWNAAGTLITSQSFSLAPKALGIVSLPGIPALVGQSGSITVTNNGRYGDLAGKAVSVETDTGFSFDTALTARPY